MTAWTALPQGKDVSVSSGEYLAVVASIGKSMTKASVVSHVPSGVTVLEYYEQGDKDAPGLGPDPDPSRKYIAVVAHSESWSGTLSWSKSILWSTLYTLISAWSAPGGGQPPELPPWPGPKGSYSPSVWPWVIAAVGVGGAAYGVYRWHAARPRTKKRIRRVVKRDLERVRYAS